MAEKSWTDCALPMIMYGVPAFTLGRFGPLWILWIMTLKSTVLPVSGSVVCGWWHSAQSLGSRRDPPCAASPPVVASRSWQLAQLVQVLCVAAVPTLILSHLSVTLAPSGRKSYSTLA